jgi:ubiquinone/menaquinone biosynthesis C-methylase UbiE
LAFSGFYANESQRNQWQNPERILRRIGLKEGLNFMDIGCGNGYFSLPAAQIVGEEGKVYAVDLNGKAIEELKERAAERGLRNLVLVTGMAEETVFCEVCADIVFYGIVLHDFNDPAKVLTNARKMIKPDGILVDLDWKKEPMDFGPPLKIRFSKEQATKLIMKARFKILRAENCGLLNYLVLAAPSGHKK